MVITQTELEAKTSAKYDDHDLVTVIRRNWGSSSISHDREDYIDRVMFVGGVARNVRYDIVKRWQRDRTVGVHVLPNDATESDFIRVTGITPMEDSRLATILHATDIDKVAALLGPDAVQKIAALHQGKTKQTTTRR